MPDTAVSSRRNKRRARKISAATVKVSASIRMTLNDHNELLQYVVKRLDFGNQFRSSILDRFRDIDVQYHAHLDLSKDDKKRDRDNKLGKALKPTDISLSLARSQIEEGATFLLTLHAPDSGMFEAVSSVETQDAALGLVKKMNYDADMKSYFAEHNLFFTNALKYNFAGMLLEWDTDLGNVFENQQGGSFELKPDETLWEGNVASNIDVYNVIWDPTVLPTEIYNKGEFFAIIDMINEFRVDVMVDNNELFGEERYQESGGSGVQQRWYEYKPNVRSKSVGHGRSNDVMDWASYFGVGSHSALGDVRAYEIVNVYIKLKPARFKLSEEKGYKIWRLTIIDGMYIANAIPLNNAHNRLPAVFTVPITDELKMQAKSYAESLIPLQTFASYLINVKQRAERKSLFGLNLYDPNIIPIGDKELDEAGYIPINPATLPSGKKIDEAFRHINDAPDTRGTLGDVAAIIALMQRFLPTEQAQQIAGLDRATQFQAAALVQAANRVNHKIGRVIDDQAMKPLRFMLIYNLYQFNKEPIAIIDPETKQPKNINPDELRQAKIEFDIGAGLKGIDRLQIVAGLGEILNRLLQVPDAFSRGDIWGLMDYWSTMQGDKSDLTRFEYKHPLDALPPEQKDQALALIKQASQQANPDGSSQP